MKNAIVFMVAGISSRFNNKIKSFVKVNKTETLIDYAIRQALDAGFSEIVFIVSGETEKPFKDKFGYVLPSGEKVSYVLQKYDKNVRSKPWGTADALCCIDGVVDCPFVICNGDDIYGVNTLKILLSHLEQSEDGATVGYPLRKVLSKTGGVNRALYVIKKGYAKKMIEVFNITEKNCINKDDLCSMNIYALHPGTIQLLSLHIESYKRRNLRDADTEFLIQHELTRLIDKGELKLKIYPTDDEWLGITHPGDEVLVQKKLKD